MFSAGVFLFDQFWWIINVGKSCSAIRRSEIQLVIFYMSISREIVLRFLSAENSERLFLCMKIVLGFPELFILFRQFLFWSFQMSGFCFESKNGSTNIQCNTNASSMQAKCLGFVKVDKWMKKIKKNRVNYCPLMKEGRIV